jgi:hypothetical protein
MATMAFAGVSRLSYPSHRVLHTRHRRRSTLLNDGVAAAIYVCAGVRLRPRRVNMSTMSLRQRRSESCRRQSDRCNNSRQVLPQIHQRKNSMDWVGEPNSGLGGGTESSSSADITDVRAGPPDGLRVRASSRYAAFVLRIEAHHMESFRSQCLCW